MERLSRILKIAALFAAVLMVRLIPFRAPNVEPVLASVMPLSKRSGMLAGAIFSVLSIVVYDALTAGWGTWTLVAAAAYALVGGASALYFGSRAASRANFVRYSIGAVLFYDAVTGLLPGPLLYGQSLSAAFMGQIPFTVLHLIGSVAFAALVSPALYRWLETSEVFALAPRTSIR